MNFFKITDFSYVGKREQNEDSIYPNSNEEYPLPIVENLFLVCDGMGGHQKGEIASDLACMQLSKYFLDNKIEDSDEQTIKNAVRYVETQFDSYIIQNPDSSGMGTTMTLAHFHKKGITIAHIGDSRIYHFRKGEMMSKTKDHSQVQVLFDAGHLSSEEEMRNHPNKNVILQALQGGSVKHTKPEIRTINDVQEGDIFFLCTDGVIETLDDAALKSIFNVNEIETIAAKIVTQCNKESSDNFSGILIEVKREYVEQLELPLVVEEKPAKNNTVIINVPDDTGEAQAVEPKAVKENTIIVQEQEPEPAPSPVKKVAQPTEQRVVPPVENRVSETTNASTFENYEKKKSSQNIVLWLLIILLSVGLSIAGYYIFSMKKDMSFYYWDKKVDDLERNEFINKQENEKVKEEIKILNGKSEETPNGTSPTGTSSTGTPSTGTLSNRTSSTGMPPNGTSSSVTTTIGASSNGTSPNGTSSSVTTTIGASPNGTSPNGTPPNNLTVKKIVDKTSFISKKDTIKKNEN